MNKASWVYNLNGDRRGIMRTLAPGIEANIFPGENVMLSVVRIEAHAQGTVHAHPEEQWGVLLEGKCTRIQDGEAIACVAGDFWQIVSKSDADVSRLHGTSRTASVASLSALTSGEVRQRSSR